MLRIGPPTLGRIETARPLQDCFGLKLETIIDPRCDECAATPNAFSVDLGMIFPARRNPSCSDQCACCAAGDGTRYCTESGCYTWELVFVSF